MAELQMKTGKGGRVNPRIDLTPMVDLGFLLITFFIMTTTMAKPKAMDIQMPYTPAKNTTAFYESSAITLLPARNHKIYYYEGLYNEKKGMKVANDETALPNILMQKQESLQQRAKPEERALQVLIKAHPSAQFNDIVALFDEMDILKIKHFAMVDIYPEEQIQIDNQLK